MKAASSYFNEFRFLFIILFSISVCCSNAWDLPSKDSVKSDEIFKPCSIDAKPPDVCSVMAPRNAEVEPQSSPSPWKIYTYKSKIQQYFTHPVTLGSDTGQQIFANYIIAAKTVNGSQIVGHFEHQWDAIPVCCYFEGKDYSEEGKYFPNLLHSSTARILKPNQTVLWTAPKYFEGEIVFTATFSTSSQIYWMNVISSPIEVIKRNHTRYPFNLKLEEAGNDIADATEETE